MSLVKPNDVTNAIIRQIKFEGLRRKRNVEDTRFIFNRGINNADANDDMHSYSCMIHFEVFIYPDNYFVVQMNTIAFDLVDNASNKSLRYGYDIAKIHNHITEYVKNNLIN